MANEKFQNALQRKAQAVPPIWFMRQAGRYHKHYQNIRKDHDFIELCKNIELATEVTMGPIEDFDFDVAILFSDLLFPLEALGMGLKYEPGPILGWHLREDNLQKLNSAKDALPELQFQKEALLSIRKRLPQEKSLIGFVGGPWTLFTYAYEGKHAGHLIDPKKSFSLFKKFSEVLVPLLIENIQLQIEGGAEVVMVFDTAAGELSPRSYLDVVAPEIEKLLKEFPGRLGYYAKGNTLSHYQAPMFKSGDWAGLGFDHRFQINDCFDWHKGFTQGNFDQAFLFADKSEFERLLEQHLEPLLKISPEERAGWVCGLGHGVLPQTPEDNVRQFVKTVRDVFA